jgi:hypothetical protein
VENLARQIRAGEDYAFMKTPMPINEDNLNRLAKTIMTKHVVGYAEAVEILGRFRLNLICDGNIARSSALQAALLTAVNTGKRAFHGGVVVSMPPGVPCLLNWPGHLTLNQVVQSLGASFVGLEHSTFSHTLYFGRPKDPVEDAFSIVCTGWRGGVVPATTALNLHNRSDFALGGVLAAAHGVARGFLRVSGLSIRHLEAAEGFSIWRPDLEWTCAEAEGPPLELLPKNLWMLGLGHLGQAFLWNFALLPYAQPSEARFLLQDFDRAVRGNFTSGLLCEEDNIGRAKTRICSDWLETRGFQTRITERPFDAHTKRTGDEPFIACCGFDAADPRRLLESAGFDLVIECALGADTSRFDRIMLHTFPDASRTADEIWATAPATPVDKMLLKAFEAEGDCGILAETLARKAVSTSFTGAYAGALVAGELLRALHGGVRCELIHAHLRYGDPPKIALRAENYLNRVARSGYVCAVTHEQMAA